MFHSFCPPLLSKKRPLEGRRVPVRALHKGTDDEAPGPGGRGLALAIGDAFRQIPPLLFHLFESSVAAKRREVFSVYQHPLGKKRMETISHDGSMVLVYIYINANMTGVYIYNDGIHGTPYIAAPLGSVMGYGS